jgi:hypothetical protein
VARQTPHFNLNMDYEDFVKAFREEEEEEKEEMTTAKVKSKSRHKKGRRPKQETEIKKISVRKKLIRKVREFERNELCTEKRVVAMRLDSKSSTKVRKAFARLRQDLSEI